MIQKNLESFSAPGTLPFHMLHKKFSLFQLSCSWIQNKWEFAVIL